MVGYQAIAGPYDEGVVENARDHSHPFCFTEAIYGVGEWLSPHRMDNISNIVWNYHHDDENDKYLRSQEVFIKENSQALKYHCLYNLTGTPAIFIKKNTLISIGLFRDLKAFQDAELILRILGIFSSFC